MQPVVLFFVSILAYIAGLVIIGKITPKLLALGFDDGLFTALAALDILGGLLAFGAIVLSLSAFNSTIAIKIVDFFLLAGIFWLSLRLALRSLRRLGKYSSALRFSHILAGVYCLFLVGAAIFAIVQFFR
jgi:hypothetical protein